MAAQQYYVEYGRELVQERLMRMLPGVIPDSCLAAQGVLESWAQMVNAAFRRVGVYIHVRTPVMQWGMNFGLYILLCMNSKSSLSLN